jgi:hypothetical protein
MRTLCYFDYQESERSAVWALAPRGDNLLLWRGLAHLPRIIFCIVLHRCAAARAQDKATRLVDSVIINEAQP